MTNIQFLKYKYPTQFEFQYGLVLMFVTYNQSTPPLNDQLLNRHTVVSQDRSYILHVAFSKYLTVESNPVLNAFSIRIMPSLTTCNSIVVIIVVGIRQGRILPLNYSSVLAPINSDSPSHILATL